MWSISKITDPVTNPVTGGGGKRGIAFRPASETSGTREMLFYVYESGSPATIHIFKARTSQITWLTTTTSIPGGGISFRPTCWSPCGTYLITTNGSQWNVYRVNDVGVMTFDFSKTSFPSFQDIGMEPTLDGRFFAGATATTSGGGARLRIVQDNQIMLNGKMGGDID